MKTFALGDAIAWDTHGGRHYKRQMGMVVEVVPAGQLPTKYRAETTIPRDHESYVVLAYRDSRTKAAYYWPRVSGLVKPE